MKLFLIGLIFTNIAFANENTQKLKSVETLTRFAFGSCNKEWKKQPMWKHIMKDAPQLFLWGGDNIYGDKGPHKNNLLYKYMVQNNNPHYKELKNTTPIIGIWDDHDYGDNNGTSDYSGKYISQQLFLDFIQEPVNSFRRTQDGIYTSYTFGSGNKQVKFILLDNRFHLIEKDEKNATILGEGQWNWLEEQFKNSSARIHFIVSGIPFLPNKMIHTEEWADYPGEKEKLLKLIDKYNVSGVIFLSGDKHFSAITKNHGHVEIMSSGLTHKTNRVLIPWIKTKFPKSFFNLNYGLIDINWNKKNPTISVKIKSQKGVALSENYTLQNKKIKSLDSTY